MGAESMGTWLCCWAGLKDSGRGSGVDARALALVVGDAGPSEPVDLAPGPAVVDELTEHDKVQKHGAEAADEPGEALYEVVVFGALQQNAGHICQIACDGKDEERKREALALCRAVLEDLRDARREVQDRREPSGHLCVPTPAHGLGCGGWQVVVAAVRVLGHPPCGHARGNDQERSDGVHDDLGADRRVVVRIILGRQIVLDDAAVADERRALVGFKRRRDGRDLDAAVVVLGVVPVLEDQHAVACAVVQSEDDLWEAAKPKPNSSALHFAGDR
ncbi:hypothetical protein L1887_57269 [Cichorium endivia]|nr:hypothetical protein L1887_57269 [Cichorium endivia]